MKRKLLLLFFILTNTWNLQAQQVIRGTVFGEKEPLQNATVSLKAAKSSVFTNAEGTFRIETGHATDTLVVSFIGFKTVSRVVTGAENVIIYLQEDARSLDEVTISTGYYETARENATGSFEHVNSELFNRAVSPDVISRLEGIVPGLHFDKRLSGDVGARDNTYSLRLRGISTLHGNSEPLIVVDDYPYEGDISNINPNTIQSVTVLRDAAAASIWGARAGNGVIVIKTKSGNYNSPTKVSFNSNVTFSARPDLSYNAEYVDSRTFTDLETQLFTKGFYAAREADLSRPILSPVVEMLIAARDGQITENQLRDYVNGLAENDVRRDAARYLYRNAVNQQYALNLSGGSKQQSYFISVGHDQNASWMRGDQNARTTLNVVNRLSPVKALQVSTNLALVAANNQNNSQDLRGMPAVYPYSVLKNDDGSAAALVRDFRQSYKALSEREGLLDWQFRPLDELSLSDNSNKSIDIRMGINLKYTIRKDLEATVGYQYHQLSVQTRTHYDQDSYYVRNLVNRFTQSDGTRAFPYGGILLTGISRQVNQALRAQVNYHKEWKRNTRLDALAGMELRENRREGNSSSFYGYDDDVLTVRPQLDYLTFYPVRPAFTSRLPVPPYSLSSFTDRNVSYYSNATFLFRDNYLLSGSVRWDASNLFGVATNQKGVPLWSAGLAWKVNKESFYKADWLPKLNLRFTYGYSGNVDKTATAFTTVTYSTSFETNLPQAGVASPGNKNLRWEKINTINMGADFGLRNNWLHGYIEYYIKRSTDLMGSVLIDPTVFHQGNLSTYRINYADMVTRGADVSLNTSDLGSTLKWSANLLFSYTANRVTKFNGTDRGSVTGYTYGNMNRPVEGNSLDALYSLPWAGLDPLTGDPLVYENEQLSKEYTRYINTLTIGDMVNHGSSVPLITASLRNNLSFKGWVISANLSMKAAYFFRRKTIDYNSVVFSGKVHSDYYNRWVNRGDELSTHIPSVPSAVVANRDIVHALSEVMVSRGDHLRLNDFSISYNFRNNPSLRIYTYFNNLGVIWKAEKRRIDPDYPFASMLPPRTMALGFTINL